MTKIDFEAARRHHAALKDLFVHHGGTGADFRALRRALALAQRASEAIDDDYAREKLRLVDEYGCELLAHAEHSKWGCDSTSGAEFLRQQILNALELVASRLYSLETLRHATEARRSHAARAGGVL